MATWDESESSDNDLEEEKAIMALMAYVGTSNEKKFQIMKQT